ncbi:type III secretion system chaperone [Paraburkholderia bonniea]|uniref:type III secretion system chaperone n=1 Tax=Paraburkholderia bonniea TaxID=2152891 RepID=UPI001291F30C|nr:type III secretion system chaperone [Paraburkholderia bonniea]WJF89312.1 type III secretion system chaperone [Paraburkholderia bonniea]WJF92628.1 type III secretion system chaperone [Paraburkholderia bonniea]
MDINKLIEQIGAVIGLPQLKLDARGLARVRIEGSPDLNLEADKEVNCLHIYSTIIPTPDDLGVELCEKLLSANTFGSKTGGASLALDKLGNEVILCHRIESDDMKAETVQAILERFVAAAEYWVKELTGLGETADATAARRDDSAAAKSMRDNFAMLNNRI